MTDERDSTYLQSHLVLSLHVHSVIYPYRNIRHNESCHVNTTDLLHNAPTLTSLGYDTCILVIMPTSKRTLLQVDALLEVDVLQQEGTLCKWAFFRLKVGAYMHIAIQGSTESLLPLLKNAHYVYYQKLRSAGKQEQRTANCVPKCLKLLYYGTWLTTQRSLVGSLR